MKKLLIVLLTVFFIFKFSEAGQNASTNLNASPASNPNPNPNPGPSPGQDAFNSLKNNNFPLSPEQIHQYKDLYDAQKKQKQHLLEVRLVKAHHRLSL